MDDLYSKAREMVKTLQATQAAAQALREAASSQNGEAAGAFANLVNWANVNGSDAATAVEAAIGECYTGGTQKTRRAQFRTFIRAAAKGWGWPLTEAGQWVGINKAYESAKLAVNGAGNVKLEKLAEEFFAAVALVEQVRRMPEGAADALLGERERLFARGDILPDGKAILAMFAYVGQAVSPQVKAAVEL